VSSYDVIVVGGGISGLTAAYEMNKKGYDVLVLEAQERVGGRVHTMRVDGKNIDVGGQWVGPTQHNILKLLEELKIGTYKQHIDGHSLFFLGYEPSSVRSLKYSGIIPNVSWMSLVDLQLAIWDIEKKCESISVDEPWECENAKEYDAMTVATYIERKFWTEEAKSQFSGCVEMVFAVDAAEISFLFFLYTIKCAGGIHAMINTVGGAQDSKIKRGAQHVPKVLAKKLAGRVKLNSPVAKIDQSFKLDRERVLVTTRSGDVYACKKVIVAVPPTLSTRIQYDPPLPGIRDQLCQRMPMACVTKMTVLFKSYWWRERGYSGFFGNLTEIDDSYPVKAGYDLTEHPGIVGFILGSKCRYWGLKSLEERRDAILAQFAKMFNVSLSYVTSQMTHYVEKDWTQVEFNRGAYMSIASPGAMTSCGFVLKEPIQNIHFAGTETATEWPGYMNGAVQAGRRAADEIDCALSSDA